MAFQFLALSYCQVAAKRDDGQFKGHTFLPEELNAKVNDRFTAYMLNCMDANRDGYTEVTFKDADGTFLKKKLEELRKLGIPKNKTRRIEIAQELADRLSTKMALSQSNPKAGAIFITEAMIDDDHRITVIKLDLNEREIIALLGQATSESIEYKSYDRALPDESRTFRKAVLYPSPGAGDARSGQFDALADYWQAFVGAEALREPAKATRSVLEVAKESHREEGKEWTELRAIELSDKVNALSEPTAQKVSETIRRTGGLNKRAANIASKLEAKLPDQQLRRFAAIKNIRYTFRQNLVLRVPTEFVRDGVVKVEKKGRDVIITIKESPLDWAEDIG